MVGASPPTRFLVTPVGQVVKTSLFHSENTSSTLVRVIRNRGVLVFSWKPSTVVFQACNGHGYIYERP